MKFLEQEPQAVFSLWLQEQAIGPPRRLLPCPAVGMQRLLVQQRFQWPFSHLHTKLLQAQTARERWARAHLCLVSPVTCMSGFLKLNWLVHLSLLGGHVALVLSQSGRVDSDTGRGEARRRREPEPADLGPRAVGTHSIGSVLAHTKGGLEAHSSSLAMLHAWSPPEDWLNGSSTAHMLPKFTDHMAARGQQAMMWGAGSDVSTRLASHFSPQQP